MNALAGSLTRIWAVATTTFREAIRNRVLYVLVAFVLALMAFSLVLGELSLHEEVRVIKDLGLSGISLFGIIIALFLGVNLLSKELDRKTVYFVIPKPLHRHEFLLGKYFGLLMTLTLLVVAMSVALLAFVVAQGGYHGTVMVRAEILVLLELLLLTAVAFLFSAFSSPYLSAMFAGALWVVGRSLPELRAFADKKLEGEALGSILQGVGNVVPDFHLYYISGANLGGDVVSIHGTFVSWEYVASTALYTLAYVALLLTASALLFARRDFS